jgi:hypothetical protein
MPLPADLERRLRETAARVRAERAAERAAKRASTREMEARLDELQRRLGQGRTSAEAERNR